MNRLKKLMAAAVVSTALLAGCAQSASPEQLLENGWKQDVQKVSIAGGLQDESAEGKPAALDLNDVQGLQTAYHVPGTLVSSAEKAAGFMNAMMPNYLTVSAWKVSEDEADTLVDETEQYLLKEQWLDAQPDGYSIFIDKDMIIVVVGISEQTEPFVTGLLKASPDLVEAASGKLVEAEANGMTDLLKTAWDKDENQVPITEDGPAALDLQDADTLETVYQVPASLVSSAKQAAGFTNAMMPNYLTVSAWQVPEGDMEQLVQDVQEHVKDVQWLDAQPDGVRLYTGKDVLVVVIGITDQTDPFVSALQKADPGLEEAASVTLES